MKKQYLLIPVVALLAAGTLVGCGQQQTPPPDVSTVAKAVAVANANGKLINSGKIVGDYGAETWFQKGEGWVYLLDMSYGEKNYYVAYGTGEENAWNIYWNTWEEVWDHEVVATERAQGYAFNATDLIGLYKTIEYEDGTTYNDTAFFYGTEALVSGLFAAAGDSVTTSIADGVYSFDFVVAAEKEVYEDGSVAETAPVYQVEVDFTLGASYTFNKVNVKSSVWYSVADGQVPADTDADYAYTYEIEQVAGESFENDYNPAELLVTDYTIVDANEQSVADATVEADRGVALELGVNITPTTADLAWNDIDVTVVDEETQTTYKKDNMLWGWGNAIEYRMNAGKLNFKVKTVGEYTVTVTIAGKATKFTMDVIDPPVREIYATVNGVKTTSVNALSGDTVVFAAGVNENAELLYEVTDISVPTGSAITKDDVTYSVDDNTWSFTPDVKGEYVITITSTSETNVDGLAPATLTVSVAGAEVVSALVGTYAENFLMYGSEVGDVDFVLNADGTGKVTFITPDGQTYSKASFKWAVLETVVDGKRAFVWSKTNAAGDTCPEEITLGNAYMLEDGSSFTVTITEQYLQDGVPFVWTFNVSGSSVESNTLTVTDNAGFGISGTYTYEIGDDNAITVKDGDGNDVTNFMFMVMPGNVIAVQLSGVPMPKTLYTDTEGVTAATDYAGTLYMIGPDGVAITFVFV